MGVKQNQFSGFQTIELPRTDWTRWAAGLAINGAFLVLLIAVPWTIHESVQPPAKYAVVLLNPVPPPLRPVEKPIVVKRIATPVAVVPKPEFQPPKPRPPVNAPKIEIVIAAPPAEPAPVPQAAIAKLELPKPTPPAPPVKVGGFGDPNGVEPSAASTTKNPAAAKVGAFDLSEGNQHGKGSAGGGTRVASAGFGDAGATAGSGPGGNGRGTVRNAGFGELDATPAVSHAAARAVQPQETPVEITFKPKPVYTAEAREKKVEGEVLLEVVFSATGRIQVLRVTRGLGFGLDESARDAASKIRFQPGTRAGNPVDLKGIVHIVFALS
jgi:TonB family protein